MTPTISVVIPVYSTAPYVSACLDSVLAQTFSDFEVICVDDASPDNSADIVESYAAKDPRVRLIRFKKNQGQGAARNAAVKAAKADYIASVDSDDTISPNMLDIAWSSIKSESPDIIVFGYDRVDEQGSLLSQWLPRGGLIENTNNSINIFETANPGFPNKVIKKSLFTDHDIWFPPYHLYAEDLATTPRLFAKAKRIHMISESHYQYFLRGDSDTRTNNDKHTLDYFKVYDILREFLISEGLLKRYQNDLIRKINSGMKFRSSTVAESTLDAYEKTQHLRHMLQMKLGYLDHVDELWDKTSGDLYDLFKTTPWSSGRAGQHESGRNGQHDISKTVKIVSALYAPFLSSNLRNKLKEDPKRFFSDGHHPIMTIGRAIVAQDLEIKGPEVKVSRGPRLKAFKLLVSPFLPDNLKQKLDSNPDKFFADAVHPGLRAAKLLLRKK